MRKGTTRLLLGLMIVGGCAWAVAWRHRSHMNHDREIEREQREALAKLVAEIGEKHEMVGRMASALNAVTDWTDAFGGKRFTENIPIGELGPVLARKDLRPLLVYGSVVDVITQGEDCKLEIDAKANLVSNIRFLLTCTPAQVEKALSHRQEAYGEALEEIRGDEGGPESETPEQKRGDEKEAELEARRGYAFIARVSTVRSGEGETIDDPSYKARFTFAEGHCLELVYVGRDYNVLARNDEAYERLNASEREDFARLMWNALREAAKSAEKLNNSPKK